ncbi:MAG: radical SAM protein [Chloroflexi bacterium]|nr:radical SAM protein [Chloroflexota bacterium]
MLGVSRLLGGAPSQADHLRYGPAVNGTDGVTRPVVVWTTSRRCNLHCIHCYSDSRDREYPEELSYEEARALLKDLASFGVPALLLSGGEPLMRPDLLDLAGFGRDLGLRLTLSTNGTMITRETAQAIKDAGFTYVGISLDGIGAEHDRFRGTRGAFEATLAGIRHCRAVEQRVGLRLTLTNRTVGQLAALFELAEREGIQRICFYHLVPSGRGRRISNASLAPEAARMAVGHIFAQALDYARRGLDIEILTVDNHADAPFLTLWAESRLDREHAEQTTRLLARNGGNRSGSAIAHVDNLGNVHPDQFSWSVRLGSVRQRPFSDIWADESQPMLAALRQRQPLLPERCRQCRFLGMCNGNLRARALSYTGDLWGFDPGCYLTDKEIGVGDGG